jgi:hypothetical protein
MPSPIAHTAMGVLIYQVARRQNSVQHRNTADLKVLLPAVLFSLLPDIDILPAIVTGDMIRFHNQWTHSLVIGIFIALAAGVFGKLFRQRFYPWFRLAFFGYQLHIIMDFFTQSSRGMLLFWPLTTQRFSAPLRLFFGFHWSENILSVEHIYTVLNELLFSGFILLVILWLRRAGRKSIRVDST